jgi:hypothetical protein
MSRKTYYLLALPLGIIKLTRLRLALAVHWSLVELSDVRLLRCYPVLLI